MTQVIDRIRNGVDSEQMYGTLDAIKAQPELGIFQFRARNHWIDGAHNRSTIHGFYGAGQEDVTREEAFELDAGEPAILLGTDTGANPAEYLLHALAACLTTSLVYVAAARGVRLTEVESTLEGDMDVRGCLGLSDEVRNGFERIRVTLPRARRRAGREAARGRRARQGAVGRVRHGQPTASRSKSASSPPERVRPHRQDRGRRAPGAPRRDARRRTSPPAPASTTARRRSRTRASTRSSEPGTSPRRSPSSTAASASRPCTTSWWRRAAWRAATRRSRSASTCTSSCCSTSCGGWQIAVAAGDERRGAPFGAWLEDVVARAAR